MMGNTTKRVFKIQTNHNINGRTGQSYEISQWLNGTLANISQSSAHKGSERGRTVDVIVEIVE